MSCSLYTLKGLASQCKDSMGGIKKVWLGVAPIKVTVDATTHTATIETDELKVYNFRKNTGSMTTTLNTSESSGNSFTTEITLQFMKQETAKRLEVLGLLMQETVGVVLDGNGKYWIIGNDFPIEASAGTAETGTASTDLNGYNVTLSAESKELPYEITDADTIAALEAIVVA